MRKSILIAEGDFPNRSKGSLIFPNYMKTEVCVDCVDDRRGEAGHHKVYWRPGDSFVKSIIGYIDGTFNWAK